MSYIYRCDHSWFENLPLIQWLFKKALVSMAYWQMGVSSHSPFCTIPYPSLKEARLHSTGIDMDEYVSRPWHKTLLESKGNTEHVRLVIWLLHCQIIYYIYIYIQFYSYIYIALPPERSLRIAFSAHLYSRSSSRFCQIRVSVYNAIWCNMNV